MGIVAMNSPTAARSAASVRSPEYAITAALLVLAAALGGVVAAALALDARSGAALGVGALLGLAAVRWDLRARRVPNAWTYPAAGVALALSATGGLGALADAIGGLGVAGGLLGVLAVLSRGGLGLGDVKLGAAFGALLGPAGALAFVLAGSVLGGVLGLGWLLAGRGLHDAVPYAPALVAGALVAWLAGGGLP